MNMSQNTENTVPEKKGFWNFIDNVKGDKVVWIIVLLLIMISALAIFSSTSALTGESRNRVDLLKNHSIFIAIGLGIIWLLNKLKGVRLFKCVSQCGFIASLVMLLMLVFDIDLGFIKAATFNKATRSLEFFGFQIHVLEFVKVAMVMYLAWALDAYWTDHEQMKKGQKTTTLKWANRLAAKSEKLAFLKESIWKRIIYLYAPVCLTTILCMKGSNSSMLFIGAMSMVILWIGRMRKRELLLIVALGIAGIFCIIGINHISGDRIFSGMRLGTLKARILDKKTIYDLVEIEKNPALGKYSDEWFDVRNDIRQPYTALLAVRQGKLVGKGSGNSTQKYIVTHIYSDYVFSLIVEEYGLLGGVFIMFLYLSLLARGATIARNCANPFAKYAVGGLSLLITAQAMMHIMVNLDVGFRTGQTLPLISDGRFAFIMFCIAFGIILSISKSAVKEVQSTEEQN